MPWDGTPDGLPDQGWDEILGRGIRAGTGGRRPATAVSALEITITPAVRSTGLSPLMVTAMRENAGRHGFKDLVAPVRPTGKATEPDLPMTDYIRRTRPDGLPADNWLRVHVRLGGARDGDVIPAGALGPVHVSVAHDHAAYVEANVWVHHRV